jgi:hypothetical protein
MSGARHKSRPSVPALARPSPGPQAEHQAQHDRMAQSPSSASTPRSASTVARVAPCAGVRHASGHEATPADTGDPPTTAPAQSEAVVGQKFLLLSCSRKFMLKCVMEVWLCRGTKRNETNTYGNGRRETRREFGGIDENRRSVSGRGIRRCWQAGDVPCAMSRLVMDTSCVGRALTGPMRDIDQNGQERTTFRVGSAFSHTMEPNVQSAERQRR